MKLNYLLILTLFTILHFSATEISAHTISQNLENTYINSYMPILFLVKLLPFIAFGMLTFKEGLKGNKLHFRWPFFIALGIGLSLGFTMHFDIASSMLVGLGVVLTGVLLIYYKKIGRSTIKYILLFLGLVLGFSFGGNFLHAENFWWFYALSLTAGCIVFVVLNNIQFIGNPRLQIFVNIASIFFILSGIFIVLLS